MWVCYVWVESLKLYFTESATKDESSVWTKDIVDWEHYVGFFKNIFYFLRETLGSQ